MSQNYKETLNLPQTEFPMRANLPKREPDWAKRWEEENIYGQIRSKMKGKKKFVLHCGPPYANGSLHMGHVLSYTLKDFVVRAKTMAGFDSPLIPGWDCHGLPIEWKVEQALNKSGKSKNDISTKELRDLCRKEADESIALQKEDWKRLGAVADFENPYLTKNPQNEAGIIREIGKLAEKGYLYKGVKSVMWSPVEETALAEAEVEYADHESTAVYVKFPVVGKENESVVIWTTTPWTLPANRAVAYGQEVTYVLLEVTEKFEKATVQIGEKVWVAEALVEGVAKMCGIEAHKVAATKKGSEFAGEKLQHPFYDFEVPMLEGFHVTTDAGTGFVHIAPSHGQEDFQIGREAGLELECHVKGDGSYDDSVEDLPQTKVKLSGMSIWDAQKRIIEEMSAANDKGQASLLRWYKFKHSYPMSWRSKKPVIFRTTPQWFVAMDDPSMNQNPMTHEDKVRPLTQEELNILQKSFSPLKDGVSLRRVALQQIKKVQWVPAYGENRITAMIEGRPDWCISRQRKWGVPIVAFYNKNTGEAYAEKEIFDHVADLVEKDGIDVWETLGVAQLLPSGWLEKNNLKAEDLEKETDILDVWIDSGTTYAHVTEAREEIAGEGALAHQADLYLEGSDQHRGWFQSSLLMSTATRGSAPYRAVLTHGFVVDGEGKKMSKSGTNGVSPKQMCEKYGMDIVRLWVASSDYSEDVRLSEEILKGVSDSYRRFRNTFRFLLGNLYDFDEAKHEVKYEELPELEKWLLGRLAEVLKEARTGYDDYLFHKVYRTLHNFCSEELSAKYFDVRKDSLYCDARSESTEGMSHRRRSCQTVLNILLKALTTHLAPLMPFTTDEVWKERFGEDACVHLEGFSEIQEVWGVDEGFSKKWDVIWEIREEADMAVERAGREGTSNLAYNLKIRLRDDKTGVSLTNNSYEISSLKEVLVSSQLDFAYDLPCSSRQEEKVCVKVEKASGQPCPRCWTYHENEGSETCPRCTAAVEALKSEAAA